MADRDYERDEDGKFASTGGGGASRKPPQRDLQSLMRSVSKGLSKDQFNKLQRFRELKAKAIKDRPGELPKGKTAAEHRALGAKTIEKHKKGIDDEKAALKKLVPEGAEVKGRVKDIDSIMGKLKLKGAQYPDASHLGDVTGLRVVANTAEDAKQTLKNIEKEYGALPVDTGRKDKSGNPIFEPVPGSRIVEFEDAFNNPKGNYRSFHLTVLTKDGLKAELQVRTKNQDKMADWAHNVYKPMNEAQAELAKSEHIKDFDKKMSDYYWEKDSGRDPGDPPEPHPDIKDAMQLVFGVPGAAAGYARQVGKVKLPGF